MDQSPKPKHTDIVEHLENVRRTLYATYLDVTNLVPKIKQNQDSNADHYYDDFDVEVPGHFATYSQEKKSMLLHIPGPIISLNASLRLWRPRDRRLYTQTNTWWYNQIEFCLLTLFENNWKTISPAAILILQSNKNDLDNIGLKALIDALQKHRVIHDDSKEDCPCVALLKYRTISAHSLDIIVTKPAVIYPTISKQVDHLMTHFSHPKTAKIERSCVERHNYSNPFY